MQAIAKARFQRISPRKARVILDMVRGKNVAIALNELRFTPRAASPIVRKLVDSAIANARQKDENVDLDALFIERAFADKAPDRHMRRYRPRAQGRATRIVKGMSHITIILSDGRTDLEPATAGDGAAESQGAPVAGEGAAAAGAVPGTDAPTTEKSPADEASGSKADDASDD
jgi:large subunit ribosomal protein L22